VTVASVTVSPATLDLDVGVDTQLTATPYNAAGDALAGKSVTWASSDNSIATVSPAGRVHAVAGGSASITATIEGKSGSANATVSPTQPPPPPPTGTTISPGQNIQAVVDAHAEGTTFTLRAGTHTGQVVIPKSGDTFIGENGAIMDGGGTARFAFDHGAGRPNNVTIQGLIIQHYAPGAHFGAINAGVASAPVSDQTVGWVIRDCEVHHNVGAGVTFGNKTQLINNNIHHNDQIGVRGNGDSVLVQGNEIAYNNPDWHYDFEGTGREFGGTKFATTHGLVVRGNYVHDNNGNALWTDVDNVDALYENNRSVSNAGAGIFHEISYQAIIRNNVTTGNGFARGWIFGPGILISASPDVEVYGNSVSGNKMGIIGIQQDRGSGAYGIHQIHNLDVHDNTVQTDGQTGIAQQINNNAIYTSWNNRFHHNTYTGLGSRPDNTPFFWMNDLQTVDAWKGFGQDVDGTFQQ
jgi:hypothetical protein